MAPTTTNQRDQADTLLAEYAFLQDCLTGLRLRAERNATLDEAGQRADRDAVARQYRQHLGRLSDAALHTEDQRLNSLFDLLTSTDFLANISDDDRNDDIDVIQDRLDMLLEERDGRRHDREDPSAQPRRGHRPVMVSRY